MSEQKNQPFPYLMAGISSLMVGLLGVAYLRHRKKRQRDAKKFVEQIEHPKIPPMTPGDGTPILHGVRVVELASVIAAPSASRILAELGAEVIKVEDPSGDYWRKFFLEYEIGRKFSSVFQCSNCNKSSIVLDLKQSQDLAEFMKLLSGADVFLTNVRTNSLKDLGLDFETISDKFPHLVYAHLTAWGRSGPETHLPGYDVGAFWARTGMAALVHGSGGYNAYSKYPLGLGDTTTGCNLVASTIFALTKRLKTGRGGLVHTSLYHVGLWCVAPYLLNAPVSEVDNDAIPDYSTTNLSPSPFNTHYKTKDGQFIFLQGLGLEEQTSHKLSACLGNHDGTYASIASKIELFECVVLQNKLTDSGVYFSVMTTIEDIYKEARGKLSSSKTFTLVPGDKLLRRIPACPIDASCSAKHGVYRSSPELGQHTDSIKANGWSHRLAAAELPVSYANDANETTMPALAGLFVVELSGSGSAAMSAGAMLSDYGAHVHAFEPVGGSHWRRSNPNFYLHLSRRKTSSELNQKGFATLSKLLAKADVVVTDLTTKALTVLGSDYSTVKTNNPRCVFVQLTSAGIEGPDVPPNGLGNFFGTSHIASDLAMLTGCAPPNLPDQLGDLITSFSLLAGVAAGFFHAQRTQEGQRVDVNELRCGVWAGSASYTFGEAGPEAIQALRMHPKSFHTNYPVPTCNSFVTKDGMAVMLLGVELPRHLSKTLKSLGLGTSKLKMIWTILFKVLPNKKPTKIEKFFPLFELLNTDIANAIGSMTWLECKKRFERHDVWYAVVQVPAHAANNRQSRETGMVTVLDGSLSLAAPSQLP